MVEKKAQTVSLETLDYFQAWSQYFKTAPKKMWEAKFLLKWAGVGENFFDVSMKRIEASV